MPPFSRRQGTWFIVVVLAVLSLPLAMVLTRWVFHGPVTSTTLHKSVSNQMNGWTTITGCKRDRAPRTWRCPVEEPGDSSGFVEYRVVVEVDSSCWTAQRVFPSVDGLPARAEGCVGLWEWQLL